MVCTKSMRVIRRSSVVNRYTTVVYDSVDVWHIVLAHKFLWCEKSVIVMDRAVTTN